MTYTLIVISEINVVTVRNKFDTLQESSEKNILQMTIMKTLLPLI